MTQKLEFRQGKILPKAMPWQTVNMSIFNSKLVLSSNFHDKGLYVLYVVNNAAEGEYGLAHL